MQQREKLVPLEDFQIDIKIHAEQLLIFCLPETLVIKECKALKVKGEMRIGLGRGVFRTLGLSQVDSGCSGSVLPLVLPSNASMK